MLRHGRRWPTSNWTHAYLEWIGQQAFDLPAHERVLRDSLRAVNECTARIERYDRLRAALVPETSQGKLIAAIQVFRGIPLLTAASIVFELDDL
ncbi:MAG: hypothetical protein AAF368_05180 [Planctomycetota bacterium]